MIWENGNASHICNYWNERCRTLCTWTGGYPDTRLFNFHIRATFMAPDDLSVTAIRWCPGRTIEDVFEAILLSHTEQMLSGVVNPRTQ